MYITDGKETRSFPVRERFLRSLGDEGWADRAPLDVPDIILWAEDVIAEIGAADG